MIIIKSNNTVVNDMRRLIYDMFYADEISVEITERLLDALEKSRSKRRY